MSNEIYKKTIEKWGQTAQLEMAQEEATELALAVRKFVRNSTEERFVDMCGEIADVEIMIEQIKYMFPSVQSRVDETKAFKLDRLSKRVDNSSFE